MYSALNALERDAGAKRPVIPDALPSSLTTRPGPGRWIHVALIGSGTIIVLGVLALVILRDRSVQPIGLQQPLSAAPTVAATPPASALLAPPASAPLSLPESAPSATALSIEPAPVVVPAGMTLPVASSAEPASLAQPVQTPAAPQVLAVTVHPSSTPTPKAPQPSRSIVANDVAASSATKDEAVSTTETDPDKVSSLAVAITGAIAAGRKEEAEALLQQLGTHLPADSITLLRLRAWQAFRANDQAQALTLYRQIVERLPGDEPASISLAALSWKSGQQDEARQIIRGLAELHPNSDIVQRYSALFGERR